jgi:hypothetical protein
MRQAKSFIEILEGQIREDLREEIRAELEAEMRIGKPSGTPERAKASTPGEISETWLAANVSKSFFQRTKTATNFYRQAAEPTPRIEKPAAAAPEPKRQGPTQRAVTTEEIVAVELIERASNAKLGHVFSEVMLKSAWRKAALRTHPDRHTTSDRETQKRMSDTFAQLAVAYDTLTRLFN